MTRELTFGSQQTLCGLPVMLFPVTKHENQGQTKMTRTAIKLIILAVCLIDLTVGQGLQNTPINYKGFVRLFCPVEKYLEEQPKNRVDTSMKLTLLRAEMSRITTIEGPPLDAYIVTSDDEHQSETVHEHDRRREYITGFQGSSGDALVTMSKAVLWTDGRYHLQADEQLDCKWTIMKEGREDVPTITQWLINEFNGRRARVGADPKLIPAFRWKLWEKQFENTSVSLVPVRENLIDNIWKVGRKEYSSLAAFVLDDKYSGKPWQEKIKQVRLEMELSSADALIITALDEIAWLFNIRGSDLPYTPVLRAYTIITYGAIHLYAPRNKLKRSTETHLKMDACYHADCVKWHNYTSFWYDISTMSQAWNTVWLPAPCGYAQGASAEIFFSIPREKHLVKPSPVIHLRAEKNEVEAKGMRNSHIRDAIAMCDFMSYMEEQMDYDTEGWDEKQVVRALDEFRLEQNLSRGLSFPTIAGYGPNAALPHYEPTNICRRIGTDSTLVIDSGGQYDDGTTDITRTMHFGIPSAEQKDAYTRVLIGNIQLSSLIFPDDLRTDQIDVLARETLWRKGEDYMHGSSHGIGHFLSVHEPPISISYLGGSANPSDCNNIRLKPGYFLSIEPGYYKDFDFGVRLENIVEVVLADKPKQWGKNYLKFREVTLVPYEPKLINVEMLTTAQRRWLNQYNRRIREEIGRELKLHLKVRAFNWLEKKTRVIPERGPVNMDFFLASHSNSLIHENTFRILFSIFILHHLCRLVFSSSR